MGTGGSGEVLNGFYEMEWDQRNGDGKRKLLACLQSLNMIYSINNTQLFVYIPYLRIYLLFFPFLFPFPFLAGGFGLLVCSLGGSEDGADALTLMALAIFATLYSIDLGEVVNKNKMSN